MPMKNWARCFGREVMIPVGSEAPLCFMERRSVDPGREDGALWYLPFWSLEDTGGDVSGVIADALALLTAFSDAVLSPTRDSRDWVTAGVRGGDCTTEAGGET